MVSIIERRASGNGDYIYKFVGLSTDEKPKASNGSSFETMDTGETFYFNKESEDWIGKADKYLTKIFVTAFPTKMLYIEGEEFEAEGMQVNAVYTDESVAENVTVNVGIDRPLTLKDKAVVVSYVENGIIKKAEIPVAVVEAEALVPVKIETGAAGTYVVTYSDETEKNVASEDVTVETETVGGYTIETVSYTDADVTVWLMNATKESAQEGEQNQEGDQNQNAGQS